MRRHLPLPSLLIAVVIGAATCGSNLRADEFVCEEAHAHLVSCCPGFAVDAQYCTYDSGCSAATRYPFLSQAESECIRKTSCALLQSSGVCARAASVPAAVEPDSEHQNAPNPGNAVRPYQRPLVCP